MDGRLIQPMARPHVDYSEVRFKILVMLYDHYARDQKMTFVLPEIAQLTGESVNVTDACLDRLKQAGRIEAGAYGLKTGRYGLTAAGRAEVEQLEDVEYTRILAKLPYTPPAAKPPADPPAYVIDPARQDGYVDPTENAAGLARARVQLDRLLDLLAGEADDEARARASSEVATFQALLAQPRIAVDLVCRFVTHVLGRLIRAFDGAALKTAVSSLLDDLLALTILGVSET